MFRNAKFNATWILVFFCFALILGNAIGCNSWKTPRKNRWKSPLWEKKQEKKELPDAPLYDPTPTGDLINHASALRNTPPQTAKSRESEKSPQKKKWYQKPFLMSNEASEINDHLGS